MQDNEPPEDFVYVDRVTTRIVTDLRYTGANNFTGAPVPGYRGNRAILTRRAARALRAVEREAMGAGWSILVWDAYRPQRAVDAFVAWRDAPCNPALKALYYPDLTKEALFAGGLIAAPSAHSRGSTVDLTLVASDPRDLGAGLAGADSPTLDTGGHFDLFAASSATAYPGVSPAQRANRQFLRDLMGRHGFENLASEWWHYTLRDEPFPDTTFDFDVRDDWPGLEPRRG